MTTTGVAVHDDDAPRGDAEQALDPAERAAIEAAKAAKKARKAQKQAEKARRLAAEYARLAGLESPDAAADVEQPVDLTKAASVVVAANGSDGDPDEKPVDETNDPVVGPDDPADPESGEQSSGRGVLVGAGIALVAGLVFAVVALIVHVGSGGSAPATAAAARDDVLLAARQDIVVLNTLDYRSVDAGLKRWSDASTGTLHASLARVSATEKKHITEARSVTTAQVLDAAVVNLDVRAGSATVIASVELTVRPAGKQAVVKRERLRTDLSRVGNTWKVSSIGQVGVTLS